ncbi:DUF3108 domain-containing protein [Massilia sp. IC2-476]|uniref:DUF3108 domain-containing protein n=1 Tax=Massilia sp. IC2-476 TaxID=2887199 RepID=UPI001D1285D2|nr:DUF3108 domain-containing protein [Massilia sp. IC2-476]MCC2972286.1 DUF3108 domain-containing protein [Massilia sp. IC2-476]
MRTIRHCLLALAAATLTLSAHAAVQNVDVGTPLPRFALLKPGTHHYLRFMRTPGGANQPIDIWAREIRFEERDGKKLMRIVQRWDGVLPTPSVRTYDSWFETGSFRPLSHERISERDGKRVVEGFVFAPDKITGMRELADNTQKDLNVASSEPTYNFETDIEVLQALPLAEGFDARINFYHPGGSAPPQRYSFRVTGSATIAGPAGPVDCWVLKTDYNRPGNESTFWFAKGSQLMLRQESPLPDGRVMVKTLID